MCKWGACEGSCSTEVADTCPVLSMLANLDTQTRNVATQTADLLPGILRWPADWTANNFFATWWTWNR
jgi:hypothetical protein